MPNPVNTQNRRAFAKAVVVSSLAGFSIGPWAAVEKSADSGHGKSSSLKASLAPKPSMLLEGRSYKADRTALASDVLNLKAFYGVVSDKLKALAGSPSRTVRQNASVALPHLSNLVRAVEVLIGNIESDFPSLIGAREADSPQLLSVKWRPPVPQNVECPPQVEIVYRLALRLGSELEGYTGIQGGPKGGNLMALSDLASGANRNKRTFADWAISKVVSSLEDNGALYRQHQRREPLMTEMALQAKKFAQ